MSEEKGSIVNEIELTEPQKKELDKRLAAFDLDQDAGSEWPSVKARILLRNELHTHA